MVKASVGTLRHRFSLYVTGWTGGVFLSFLGSFPRDSGFRVLGEALYFWSNMDILHLGPLARRSNRPTSPFILSHLVFLLSLRPIQKGRGSLLPLSPSRLPLQLFADTSILDAFPPGRVISVLKASLLPRQIPPTKQVWRSIPPGGLPSWDSLHRHAQHLRGFT